MEEKLVSTVHTFVGKMPNTLRSVGVYPPLNLASVAGDGGQKRPAAAGGAAAAKRCYFPVGNGYLAE